VKADSEEVLGWVTGLRAKDGDGQPVRDEDVWATLDRYPDRYDKTGVRVAEGGPKRTKANVARVLEHDPRLVELCRFNAFTGLVEIRGDAASDHAETGVALFLSQVYGLEMATTTVAELLRLRAHERPYNPVADYLRSLVWDGLERLSSWLSQFLGAEDTLLNAHLGIKWAISAVARVLAPGCKVDTVLILAGPQGARKSTAFKVLAGEAWFSDSTVDLRSKDAYALLQGKWVVEFAELDNVRRREATAVKAFLSSAVDRYRPAYARNPVEWMRQCVIVGTTNEPTFLSDSTGSRRFWPVAVGEIDLEALTAVRDQLWAEAVARYQAGEPWWLDPATERALAADAERYANTDPWLESVERYLQGRSLVTVHELLDKAIGMDTERMSRIAQMRVASLLGQLGWTKESRRRMHGRLVYPWSAPAARQGALVESPPS
jgi:putative DNA primase/helicase